MDQRNFKPQYKRPVMSFRRGLRTLSIVVGVVASLSMGKFLMSENHKPAGERDHSLMAALDTDLAAVSSTAQTLEAGPTDAASSAAEDTKAPSIPSNIQLVSVTPTSVEITWDPSTDRGGNEVGGYQIYRDGELLPIEIPQSASPRFVDLDLEHKTTYTYGVLAFDTANNMSVVRQITVRTTQGDFTPPNIPSNLKVMAASSERVALSWDEAVDDESRLLGYLVYRDGKLIGSVSEPLFMDDDLLEQTRYTYAISSVDDANPPNESAKRQITVTIDAPVDADR